MKLSKENRIKALLLIGVIFVSVILLVSATMAWIETAVNPVIRANQLELATSPGLYMKINGVQQDVIDINKYLSDNADKPFILSEMSSADGNIFFVRVPSTTSDGSDGAESTLSGGAETITLRLAQSGDKNVSYIHMKIKLIADGADRAVYLGDTSDTTLTYLRSTVSSDANADELKPVRMAISYSYTSGEIVHSATEIFATYVDLDNPTKAVKTIDWTNFQMIDSGLENQVVSLVNKYYYSASSSTNTPLFTLPNGVSADVEVKIWLEGCDEYCVDSISGSHLDFKLTFFTPPDILN